jgi:hypothetical protein
VERRDEPVKLDSLGTIREFAERFGLSVTASQAPRPHPFQEDLFNSVTSGAFPTFLGGPGPRDKPVGAVEKFGPKYEFAELPSILPPPERFPSEGPRPRTFKDRPPEEPGTPLLKDGLDPAPPHGLGLQLHVCKNGSDEPLVPERMLWLRSYGSRKPQGGLWTSSYLGERGSDWVRYFSGDWAAWEPEWAEGGGVYGCHLLVPRADARVLMLRDEEDLERAWESYAWKNKDYPGDRSRSIAWHAVAEEWDAVHVTGNCVRTCEHAQPFPAYGWDAESTCWFRWAFESAESIGTQTFKTTTEDEA